MSNAVDDSSPAVSQLEQHETKMTRAAESQRKQVKQYLQKHKAKWKMETMDQPQTRRLPISSKKCANVKPTGKRQSKPNMMSLPDEITFKIFQYLGARDLLLCGRVCKRWNNLANDNLLWVKIFQVRVGSTSSTFLDKPYSYWKSQCIKRCSEQRNKQALRQLTKIHPYTGLPRETSNIVGRLGLNWQLVLRDANGCDCLLMATDHFQFQMSVTLRWYSLQNPAMGQIKKILIYSVNPLFYDKGKPVEGSPYQRSLLHEENISWASWTKTHKAAASDDTVDLYTLPSGIMIGTWAGGSEIAFVSYSLHHNQLLQKCLLGTNNSVYLSPPRTSFDDVDTSYGLHGYTCTVELRNQRKSFWSEQFRSLYCDRQSFAGGHAVLNLIRTDETSSHRAISEKIVFPWKTDTFRGKLQNIAVLDVTVLDDRGKPYWCVSSPVKLNVHSEENAQSFDYSQGCRFSICHIDGKGKVIMQLCLNAERGQYFVTCLQLALSLTEINHWFSTTYS